MGKMTLVMGNYQQPTKAQQFEALLSAWRKGENVAWADLMAAWVKAPTAPLTQETVQKVIHCLEKK